MTAEDRATAVQLVRATAADHLGHLDRAERDELVERISAAIERCGRRREVAAWDAGHAVGWEHCRDGNHGNDYWDDDTSNPYREGL